ncbi:hypothetical protein SO802_009493 [Lithocarpus litseifolius]|uniref:Uncharacterized protein n=1 Tax=Lithocarpus litseifolius TaxID=425828 RepID=A0AAW2DC71_9ROSI
MMNLRAVLSKLINKRTCGVIDNMQKNFGLALCFMGKFLLCSRRLGFVDARAIGIVSQVKDGDNLVSLIIAKTLLGLDSVFHGGESQNFLGSPLSLQIWLMERLDMITTPTVADYGGKGRKPLTSVDTNPTSIWNILLSLEMADRVDQSFIKVHFQRMTTNYSNWLVNKIADKEADMVAMRKQFLIDNRERHEVDNYEFKRRVKGDEVPSTYEINEQPNGKRLKKK